MCSALTKQHRRTRKGHIQKQSFGFGTSANQTDSVAALERTGFKVRQGRSALRSQRKSLNFGTIGIGNIALITDEIAFRFLGNTSICFMSLAGPLFADRATFSNAIYDEWLGH